MPLSTRLSFNIEEITSSATPGILGFPCNKTFVRVMLPNAISALVVVFLFSIVWYWNDYYYNSVFLQNVSTLSNQLPRLESLINAALRPAGSGNLIDPNELTVMLQAGCLFFFARSLPYAKGKIK